jgi:uncharacterized membrane protein YhaH (DUF805 family)
MITLLTFWFTRTAPVTRRAYVATGVTLAVLKYAVDAALVWIGAGLVWTPADYVHSAPLALNWPLARADAWLLPVLLIWTLPFIWIGVTLTARRARDAGWSEWLCFLFFVPYLNYALMALLSLLPSAAVSAPVRADGAAPPAPSTAREGQVGDALVAGVVGVLIGLAMTWLSVVIVRAYGAAMFFGAPFAVGVSTAFVYNLRSPSTLSRTNGVVAGTLAICGLAFLVTGTEGAVCLLMALPIAIPIGLLGAFLGRVFALGPGRDARPSILGLVALPLWILLEPAGATGHILHEVRSSIEIAASPDVVWPRVIAFDPLPAATELVFRIGVAAPESAHIDGAGVGAVRYCVFSTGAFVEPITRWEPGHRLSFDVTSSPPPMREWSPYPDLHPPHLDGFLRSRRGEFRLVALDGGRTRLEGSTWYELEMGPEGYWQMFSDVIIHRIHMRVLAHIKHEAEQGGR